MLLCHGMSCYVMGSQRLVQNLEDVWGIDDGGTTADGELTVQVVNGCLGVCDRAPICKLDADFYGDLTPENAQRGHLRRDCRGWQLAGRASSRARWEQP